MDTEKVVIGLLKDKTNYLNGEFILFEEAPDDEDMIMLEAIFDGKRKCYKSTNFFSALQDMRRELENKNIQILCNGSAKNVHPSAMQLSMGYGRKAYKLYIGRQARTSDMVDIFEYDKELEFATVDEQEKFYNDWIECFSML